MEPVPIRLKRKYTNPKSVKQNKSSSSNAGHSNKKKISKAEKNALPVRKVAMFVDGRTGHYVIRDVA